MKWKVTFYNEKVEEETLGFPPGILANFLHISEMIEALGPNLGKPYVRVIKEGIGRSLYCTLKGQEIIILNSFIKKTKKTPKKELSLARKRMKEVSK